MISTTRLPRAMVAGLLTLPVVGMGLGCGNDNPPTGTSVVVDPVQAADQGKSTADYYKKNPRAVQRDDGSRR